MTAKVVGKYIRMRVPRLAVLTSVVNTLGVVCLACFAVTQFYAINYESELYDALDGSLLGVPLTSPSNISTLGFDRIFVLTLSRRRDRQHYMRMFAKKWQLGVEFSMGVSGRDQAQMELFKKHVDPGANLTVGEISTYGSHYQLSQLIRQRDYQHALIVEDDIMVADDVKSVANLHLLMRLALEYVKKDYDVLYFGHCYGREEKQKLVARIDIGGPLMWSIREKATCGCGHAYAVSRQGAEKILRGLNVVGQAWDMALRDLVKFGKVKAYAVWPPLFNQLWQIVRVKVNKENSRLLCSDGKYTRSAACPRTDGQVV